MLIGCTADCHGEFPVLNDKIDEFYIIGDAVEKGNIDEFDQLDKWAEKQKCKIFLIPDIHDLWGNAAKPLKLENVEVLPHGLNIVHKFIGMSHVPPIAQNIKIGRAGGEGIAWIGVMAILLQVKILLCGHIHEDAGMAFNFQNLTVVNCSKIVRYIEC